MHLSHICLHITWARLGTAPSKAGGWAAAGRQHRLRMHCQHQWCTRMAAVQTGEDGELHGRWLDSASSQYHHHDSAHSCANTDSSNASVCSRTAPAWHPPFPHRHALCGRSSGAGGVPTRGTGYSKARAPGSTPGPWGCPRARRCRSCPSSTQGLRSPSLPQAHLPQCPLQLRDTMICCLLRGVLKEDKTC